MPEDYKKKLEEAGLALSQALKDNAELTAEDVAGMTRMAQDKAQRIADQQYLDESASINRLAKVQGEAEKSGADMLIEMGNQIRNTQKEGESQVEADNRAARWTSAAELAASIANMIGVGSFGAVNQQYKSYSQDWMKKADTDMREHRARMDNLNERLRVQKERLNALKLGNAQTLEGMRQRAAANLSQASQTINNMGLQGGMRAAEIQSKASDNAAQVEYNTTRDAINVGMQEQARRDANAARDAQINLQYDLHGWTTDPKTGRRVAPATGTGGTGRGSGSGSGSSSNIMLSIPPTTEGGKGTRLTINSGSLIATINANVDLFKSNDQKAIQRILRGTGSQDDKAKQLEQYIKTSPEILDLLKLSSLAVDEFDWGKTETTQAAEAPSQRSQGSVGSAADLDKLIGG